VHTTTNQPDTKFNYNTNPNPNPNTTTKQYVLRIQRNSYKTLLSHCFYQLQL